LPSVGTPVGFITAQAWPRARLAPQSSAPGSISSEDIDDTELASLIWSLPAADYPKAWLLWQRLESRELQNRFRRALLEYWAEVDPHSAAAAAWVRQLPEGPLRRQAWEGLKSRLSWSNPEAAADAWLQQTDLPENRKALIFATPSRSP
jgi:hypothetical protein